MRILIPYSRRTAGAIASLILGAALAACASAQSDDGYGVLVMAHGGSAEWNADVLRSIEPLRAVYPVEVAFGMADPATMQEAVARLETAGARRVGVVRLFVSGESFLERTEQILGYAPARRRGRRGGPPTAQAVTRTASGASNQAPGSRSAGRASTSEARSATCWPTGRWT